MLGWDETSVSGKGFGAGLSNASKNGSLELTNGSNSFLLVQNSADFAVGAGDFTVEWFQYATSITLYMRCFSIGAYSDGCTLAVASQSGQMYFWIASSANGVGAACGSHGTITDGWHHFALVRASGNVKLYKDGVNLSGVGVSNSNNATYNAGHYFSIGAETTDGVAGTIPGSVEFNGKISNFRFVKGTALYTSDFSTPAINIDNVAGTELLLLCKRTAPTLDSAKNRSVSIVNNVAWSSSRPI